MIDWLQQWYFEQCNGDWEHEYGVSIQTIDNPGWMVTIDLAFTEGEDLVIPYKLNHKSDNDWIGYSITNRQFVRSGDAGKLNEIIRIFKNIWQGHLP